MSISPFEYRQLPRTTAAVLSPDGLWLAVTVQRPDEESASYVSDLWRVPRDGGPPVQLTDGDSNDHAPCFRRDGALLFLSDRPLPDQEEEGRHAQVWMLDDGELVPLTDEALGVSAFALGGDRMVMLVPSLPGVPREEQRFVELDRKKNGPSARRYDQLPVRHWDHWLGPAWPQLVLIDGERRVELTAGTARQLHEASMDISADGSRAVVTAERDGDDGLSDRSLLVFSLDSGASMELGHEPGVRYDSPQLSPDGRTIACTRHQRSPEAHGPTMLWIFEDGEGAQLAAGWDRWPEPVAWRAGAVVVVARDEGVSALLTIERDGTTTRLTDTGTCEGISVVGERIVGLHHSLLRPPRPVIFDDGRMEEHPLFPDPDLGVEVSVEWVVADDGTPIHGFVLRPREHTGPLPGLLWVHGGPVSHWGDWWHWRWNAACFASAGYAVALPNPRGSTGFGQAFIEGIWRNRWGEQCYADVMAWMQAFAERPDVDSERIGAMGASFGGYMVNWLGGSTDRLRCIVSHAGIFDHRSFYGVTDYPHWWGLQFGCTPYSDPLAHARYSPQSRVQHWTTPTLITHGEKDYRCPIDQGLALFTALKGQGVEAELLVFPDEGHWIQKPRNVSAWLEAVLAFVARHLR